MSRHLEGDTLSSVGGHNVIQGGAAVKGTKSGFPKRIIALQNVKFKPKRHITAIKWKMAG